MAPTNLLGLTTLGTFHTAISLVALAAGIIALARYKEISPGNLVGKVYIATTLITALTGFGIFQHGGFGKPHALGILTLIVLAIVAVAGATRLFGGASRYVETVGYSATFFFHWIPAVTETTTRLPAGDPVFANPDAPGLQIITAALFVVFLIGATLQVLRLRARLRLLPASA
jgi:uncharacterized membrane protein